MLNVTIHKAKTNLSQLIEKACSGQEVVISRGSEPMVRLVPVREPNGNRKPGRLKGKISYTDDAFAPLTDQELDELGFE